MTTNNPKQTALKDATLALLNVELNPSHLRRIADGLASQLNGIYQAHKERKELSAQPARQSMSFRG